MRTRTRKRIHVHAQVHVHAHLHVHVLIPCVCIAAGRLPYQRGSIFETYVQSKRMMFRFVVHKDRERLRRTFQRKRELEATSDEPWVDGKRAKALVAPTIADPLPLSNEPHEQSTQSEASGTQEGAASIPTAAQRVPSRTPSRSPEANAVGLGKAKVKPSKSKTVSVYVDAAAEGAQGPETTDDPKKQLAKSEKAFQQILQSFSVCLTQATGVNENIDTAADWAWIKHTPHYPNFEKAYSSFNALKMEFPMLKSLLVKNDFGPAQPCKPTLLSNFKIEMTKNSKPFPLLSSGDQTREARGFGGGTAPSALLFFLPSPLRYGIIMYMQVLWS